MTWHRFAAACKVRRLSKELWALMPDTDPRWKNFGLNPPGWPEVPGRVENLLVTPQLAGTLLLNWDASPLAARY